MISKACLSKVFVGRAPELDRLRAALTQSRGGGGRVIVISGEQGVGKKTLLRQFAGRVAHDETAFVQVNCTDYQAYQPHAPFLRIVEELVGKARLETLGLIGQAEGEKGGDLESLYALQKEQGLVQQRLASAILDAARDKTLVIGLNDVHLATLSAWKFIHYLAERISSSKVVLVLTVLQEGAKMIADQAPSHTDVLQRMNRERLLDQIRLNRLNVEEVRQYLNQAFPKSDFSSGFAETACEISHGNPAALAKFLDLAQKKKVLYQEEGVWFNNEVISKEKLVELVSDDFDLTQASELTGNLSAEHRELLEFAALVNGPFDHRILAVVERARVHIIKDLVTLKEINILTQVGETHYQFSHSALRAILLNDTSLQAQEKMHLKIAEKVAGHDAFDAGEKVFLLAYHYGRTKELEQAHRYLYAAGRLAIENFAFLEAREYLDKAFNLHADLREAVSRNDRIEILIRLAWLDHVLGDWKVTLERCRAALALCPPDGDDELKTRVLIQQGLTNFRLNNWSEARRCFQECRKRADKIGRFELAMVDYGSGDVDFETGKYDSARKHFEQALLISRELDNPQFTANIINNVATLEIVSGQHLRAIARFSQAIAAYKQLGDDFGQARCYHNIGMSHADQKNWQEADNFYGCSLKISERMGLRPLKAITFLNRALALAHLSSFEEAREYNFKASQLLKRLNDDLGMAEYHKIQGLIERKQNNWKEAREHYDTSLAKFQAAENWLGVAEAFWELALLVRDMNIDGAIECFQKAASTYEELGLPEKVREIRSQMTECVPGARVETAKMQIIA